MAKMEGSSAGGSSGKKGFSSRLLQMKFMRRKQEKRKAEEDIEQVVKPEEPMAEDAQWVSERSQKGCILIYENDPPPGALLGHMAFGGFNPETERLQDEAEKRLQAAKQGANDGPAVTDLEMASQMGYGDTKISSMRMQKKRSRKK